MCLRPYSIRSMLHDSSIVVGFTPPDTDMRRFQYQEMVDFAIGITATRFFVPAALICHRSSFVKAALSKRWNAVQKPVELTNVRPEHFDWYLAYIYGHDATVVVQDDDKFALCARMYIPADRLGDCRSAYDSLRRSLSIMEVCQDNVRCHQFGFTASPASGGSLRPSSFRKELRRAME